MKRALPIFIFFGLVFAVLLFMVYYEPPQRDVLDEGIWKVFDLNSTPLVEGTTLTLRFHDGVVRGSSGCNTFNGQYEVKGENISINALELTTDNCMEPGIMEQERAFTGYLKNAAAFSVTADDLTIRMADGSMVKFISLLEE